MLKNKNVKTVDGIIIIALFCAFWCFFTFMAVSAMEDNATMTRICAFEVLMTTVSNIIMGHKIRNEED